MVRDCQPQKFSPYVVKQLCILSICRFAEPIAMTSIFPYLYYMIESFGVPASNISYYAGITAASFSFSQFLTGLFWGRVSEITGRKPLILIGLFGTMTTLLLFGFSTQLWMAIFARLLSGLVNGNVGILRTVVAELVPERSLQARAFSIMPLVWNLASVIGPMIGGALADPLKNHPEWFHGKRPAFFVNFPFALPSIVASLFFVIGLPIGFLFLDETLAEKKDRHDVGRELGKKITSCIQGRKAHHKNIHDEASSLLSGTSDEEDISIVSAKAEPSKPASTPPIMAALTFQSTMNVIYYMLLAMHSVVFDQLIPVFLSYPVQDPVEQRLPFRFAGGFGMSSAEVGTIFSIFGICSMLLQFLLFPPIANRLGSHQCLQIVSLIFPVAYFAVPFLVVLPTNLQKPALYTIMSMKSLSGVFAFPCSTILLTNSSPSLRVLGTLNGIAVAVAAMGRTLGPSLGGILFSHGQKTGYLILPWWILSALTLLNFLPTMVMVDKGGIGGEGDNASENMIEALLPEPVPDTTNKGYSSVEVTQPYTRSSNSSSSVLKITK